MRSGWRWLARAISVLWYIDVDARVKSTLETQKDNFDKEIAQIAEDGRKLDSDIRNLEEEAATLHKQRVRKMHKVLCSGSIVEGKKEHPLPYWLTHDCISLGAATLVVEFLGLFSSLLLRVGSVKQ